MLKIKKKWDFTVFVIQIGHFPELLEKKGFIFNFTHILQQFSVTSA